MHVAADMGSAVSLHTAGSPALWLGFGAVVAAMLALDLGVFHRKAHAIGKREALITSAIWVALALGFAGFVYVKLGPEAGSEFLSGYLIEKSLSVDNLFVFSVVFTALGIPAQYQHRVLFWGVLGALVMRALMIAAGAMMLQHMHWLGYVFGAFLIFTGVKLFVARHPEAAAEPWMIRLTRRFLPMTNRFDQQRFLTREHGRLVATPLFFALCVVELSDVVFAVDSIPAVLAVTDDPFIVFSSNVFAMLGLRALYGLLADFVANFRHLKHGLAAVLVFVGLKMSLAGVYKIPPLASLAVICGLLAVSVMVSVVERALQKEKARRESQEDAKTGSRIRVS